MELYETIPVRVRAKQYTQEMQDSFIALGDEIENPIDVSLEFIPNIYLKWYFETKQLLIRVFVGYWKIIDIGDFIVCKSVGGDEYYDILEQDEMEQTYKKVLDLENIDKKVDKALDNITSQDVIKYFPSVAENVLNNGLNEKNKEDARSKSLIALREHLANMTPKEKAEMQEHFRDKRPKGWLSIEEHLPMMYAMDIEKGYSEFKVKFADGEESYTRVADHNTWYYNAKENGITHWLNE